MKIVVLDGFTLNPGDLDWSLLSAIGKAVIYDRTAPDEVLTRAEDADIILTNKVVLDGSTLEKLKALKLIAVTATGCNNIDLDAARNLDIKVCNASNYSSQSVAQHTFALLLELTNHCGSHSNSVAANTWANSPDWSFHISPLIEIASLTIGIVGFGNIGQKVAQIARGFDMKVIVSHKHPERDYQPDVNFVELNDLFSQSDVMSLHCPLNNKNLKFINEQSLSLMKPSALLINTSRGPLIDEKALYHALTTGQIAGAGLDVLTKEPPEINHPLTTLKNCIITPHHAWATQAARKRLMETVVANIKAFQSGNPINMVPG